MNNNINMENYLSDEEIEIEPTFDELYPDEELDEETLSIIRASIKDNDDLDLFMKNKNKDNDKDNDNDKKKKQNVKVKNEKSNTLTLNDLNKLYEGPKKWVSQRMEAKRTVEPPAVKKRSFNPRLPPYMSIRNNKTKNNINVSVTDEIAFPKLGKN
jgi:hypothetical protein